MAERTLRKLKVFISYSHEDSLWKDVLLRHLRVLERTNVVEFWDASDVEPGTDWSTEIVQVVRSVDMAVLLLSPSFLASDFISDKELPLLLERRKKEMLVILPILCARQVGHMSKSSPSFNSSMILRNRFPNSRTLIKSTRLPRWLSGSPSSQKRCARKRLALDPLADPESNLT